MMSERITPISWKKFEKFLIYIGCVFIREKGDHRVYTKSGLKRPIIIPRDDQLPVFIIKSNLKTLELSNIEYLNILKKI